jgi:hypothetical protein
MHECFAIFLRVTELASPMSRRKVPNRRESLLPLLIPDRHQTGVVFDPCIPSGPAVAIKGKMGESPEAWTCHCTHYRQAKQASPTAEARITELIAENHLWARLVFQRIRPRTHSGMIGGQTRSSEELEVTRAPVAPPNTATPLVKCLEAPIAPAIEIVFTQLARRCLRIHATDKTR